MAKTKLSKPKASGPKLKLDPNNARTHTPEGDAMIDASLDEIGPFRSIALDGDDVVRAGNGVYARAKARGLKVRIVDAKPDELIAVRRKDLKGLKAQRAALFDNRAGELSRWNGSVLAELPNKLKDGLWDADSFSQLLTDLGHKSETEPADAEPQIDRAAELQAKWKTERGQLWAIGEHRLLCGDSTMREDVERVMGGEKAAICFTSPPYNAGISAKLRGNTSIDDNLYKNEYNDNQKQSDYLRLLDLFTCAAINVSDYVFVNIQPLAGNKRALVEYWFKFVDKFADVAIWDKTHAAPAQARRVMDSRFEFVIVFSEGATRAIGTRDFHGMVHNVFASQPQRNNEFSDIHAATFPIELPTHFINTFTNSGECIYEPFTGTGTTLVACQNLSRKCRAVEISPAYCGVILQRMQDAFPNLSIALVNESSPKKRRKPTP